MQMINESLLKGFDLNMYVASLVLIHKLSFLHRRMKSKNLSFILFSRNLGILNSTHTHTYTQKKRKNKGRK